MADKSTWPKLVEMTGAVLVTETTAEARLAVAALSPSKRVAFSAVGDTCPLCEALDGKVFRVDSPEAEMFSPPLHINCDCIWVEVGDDEVGSQDLFTSEDHAALQDLIDTHAHFITAPDKYTPLRVPAGPSGRDFTFRRVKDPVSGELRSVVEWHRPRYALESPGPGLTLPEQRGVTEVGPKWETVGQTPSGPASIDTMPPGNTPRTPGFGGLPDRANLDGLSGHLTVTGETYPDVQDHLDDLARLPASLYQDLAEKGLEVFVGPGNVTQLDQNEDLIGRPVPYGRGTKTEDHFAMYRPDRKAVTVGTGGINSESPALHEIGHAIGDLHKINHSQELRDHFQRLSDAGELPRSLKPYGASDAALRELFAEAVALSVRNEALARIMLGNEMVDWVLSVLRSIA